MWRVDSAGFRRLRASGTAPSWNTNLTAFGLEQLALAQLVLRHSRRECRHLLQQAGSALACYYAAGGTAARLRRYGADLARSDIILLTETRFPPCLQAIPDPPLILYARGEDQLLTNTPTLALVGSRRCSRAGSMLAEELARALAENGCTVVSGLALGVDGAAHRGALATGRTIAVLGSGLDRVYPARHQRFARDLLASGALLLSEYPPQASARPYRFPERNRIISGLSQLVLVVEATLRSGSLITARLALEQGRDVLAVPGDVAAGRHAGCHWLLRQGAGLVETLEDVYHALGLTAPGADLHRPGAGRPLPRDALAAQVLKTLSGRPLSLDELAVQTGLSPETLLEALVNLELDGFVASQAEGYIRRPDIG